jgi:bacteriorhodopsin
MTLNIIFLIGALAFAAASVYFWLSDDKEFNSPLLVVAVTTLSYLVMLEGGLAIEQFDGAVIHWSRWAGYGLSCPLLFYVVASGIKSFQRRLTLTALMSLVMITGAFAAAWSGWFFWAGFVLSSFFFAVTLIELYEYSDEKSLRPMHKYVWFGWFIFPVVFLIGPSGLYVVSAAVVALAYLLLDIYTKIVFYVELDYRKQNSNQGYWQVVKSIMGR